MIQNPAEFVGRTAELQFLLTRLRSLQSCSVVGERRIGKSLLLYHLHRRARRGWANTSINSSSWRRSAANASCWRLTNTKGWKKASRAATSRKMYWASCATSFSTALALSCWCWAASLRGRFEELTGVNWASYLSNARTLEPSFLDESSARELLTEPVPQLRYEDGVLAEILRLTHCQPYLL